MINAALKMHGAVGYSSELRLERMVRDARLFTIASGTAQTRDDYAKLPSEDTFRKVRAA